jgi:glycosyltransferase involved in cell wall biosynthesis
VPEDLRVLVISHGHPGLSIGGGEVASYNLHEGLKRRGVDSFFLARAASPLPRHGASALLRFGEREDEALFHSDDYDHFLLSNRNTDDIERDLLRLVRLQRPDVVHFHHVIGLGLEAIYAIREALPDAAIVFTFHEMLSLCHLDGQMKKRSGALCSRPSPLACHQCFPNIPPMRFLQRERFIRGMLELVDHYVSPSTFLAERYVSWGLPTERMSVIENGLSVAEPVEARRLARSGNRRSRFAFFGQMMPSKGVDVLLEAVARVPEKVWGEDAGLMLFGSNLERQPPEFRTRVEELIARCGPRARLYGAYQNSEMPRLMQSADWVIVPSTWWENSPVVIQEAFFHGRPVIASNIGGMAEKVHDGIDGMHFRVGSAEDLADRLVHALTESKLWEKLRGGITQPLSHEESAARHIDLYRAILESRRAGGDFMVREAASSA